jgi:hypothetical protein
LWALEEIGLPYESVGMGIPITIATHRRTARCTERPAWKKTVEAYDKRANPPDSEPVDGACRQQLASASIAVR